VYTAFIAKQPNPWPNGIVGSEVDFVQSSRSGPKPSHTAKGLFKTI